MNRDYLLDKAASVLQLLLLPIAFDLPIACDSFDLLLLRFNQLVQLCYDGIPFVIICEETQSLRVSRTNKFFQNHAFVSQRDRLLEEK